MVSFSATAEGTPAATWEADSRFAGAAALSLDGVKRLVVVSPHPDDESLGAGGLIAECARHDVEVEIVVVTDGAASHPAVETLADTRSDELRRAVSLLAPKASVIFLGLADGQVREQRDTLAASLSELFTGFGADTLVASPWRGDGHRDHRIVGEVCFELAAAHNFTLIEYPIWMWHWATPEHEEIPWNRVASLQLSASSIACKRAALTQFESQLGDVITPSFLEHFTRTTEIFMTVDRHSTTGSGALTEDYFASLYERHSDPWGFESRWYEKRKRALTVAALPEERYGRVLELGCSIGMLTEQLALRSDALLATDISAAAVARATERLDSYSNVEVRQADAATGLPGAGFDLIVMSEVGYYFDRATLDAVLSDVLGRLAPNATFVACHWLHPVADYPLSGEVVHEKIGALPGLHRLVSHREDDFILEVFSRDSRSVARREGLV